MCLCIFVCLFVCVCDPFACSFLGQIQCANMHGSNENNSISEGEGELTQCMMQLIDDVTTCSET